ncbi:Asp/Glu/hydantoin racemase [Variovorax sp. YR266]|uniref:aspartate/glutamate racemase family protein n=1 Tax=Variovorax sp. YR266 TaxID=1884386 RepID=UPI0008993C35|nr:aspartate/glutamate racemase family protein [Variovorax sp. YR266]SDY33413.1 Asp/Glu/hydantoin racemase [Variovorax sp. YR266]
MNSERMRLLVINPNTSTAVSELLHRTIASCCGKEVDVVVRQARFGAPYISSASSYAVAEHAALDAWAAAEEVRGSRASSVLIGCFGDPGLFALKECSEAPVTGLAISSIARAASMGRFAIVTGGHGWKPILTRFVHATGYARDLATIETVALSGADLAARPDMAKNVLLEACRRAERFADVQSIIVGGAALAGMAEVLQPLVETTLFDSVVEGAREAIRMASLEAAPTRPRTEFEWVGLSAEMQAMTIKPFRMQTMQGDLRVKNQLSRPK